MCVCTWWRVERTCCSLSCAMIFSLLSAPFTSKSNQDWNLHVFNITLSLYEPLYSLNHPPTHCIHSITHPLYSLNHPPTHCTHSITHPPTVFTQSPTHCTHSITHCTHSITHPPTHPLRSSKMSGRMKLSRDHSSARLFCSGVPVSSRRLAASYAFRDLGKREGGDHFFSPEMRIPPLIRMLYHAPKAVRISEVCCI